MTIAETGRHVLWFEQLRRTDVGRVGGKNASLGEMVQTLAADGIAVPGGFATTADAYRRFVEVNEIGDRMAALLDQWKGGQPLTRIGPAIRRLFLEGRIPGDVAEAIVDAYRELSGRHGVEATDVAVRSSATAEDLPEASFAGQQETYLNIEGEARLLDACRRCFASLFTDRAIAYRDASGFDHLSIALSVGVQKMVRSDRGSAGVLFTLDTESGFPGVVVINGAWGLGENVVRGSVTPDEFTVFKALLDDPEVVPILDRRLGAKEWKMVYGQCGETENIPTSAAERRRFVLDDQRILTLARWGCRIEEHYGMPMDIEWAVDGDTGELFIVQARPETVQSHKTEGALRTYRLQEVGTPLVEGLAIGEAIAVGEVCHLDDPTAIDEFVDGSILVTGMTTPDWVPIMKRAAGIVTDAGGRTCHAAIVSRELGIPAVVGTGRATRDLADGRLVTLSCAEGDHGTIYDGRLAFESFEVELDGLPATRTSILLNIASPSAAFHWWRLPCRGIGLARLEFIINNDIGIHPMALVDLDRVTDDDERRRILEATHGHPDPARFFVESLASGVARIAATRHPDPVIVRMSDFKTNEYANLLGGRFFEPHEENPMIGFRGASRYYSPAYREGFALECRAIDLVRRTIGLTNVIVMIPFCRTLEEADRVLEVMAGFGLERGQHGLEVYVMCEIPSNVLLAEGFARRFDGFSIGSNDLTQLVLGVDRDSAELAGLFDERNEAVQMMIRMVIERAHAAGRKVGICGQAPSDHPEFAEFLVEAGIDSISLNPDSVVDTIRRVAAVEGR